MGDFDTMDREPIGFGLIFNTTMRINCRGN